MKSMSMDLRITGMEEKLSHLEKLVDDLNQVIRKLGDQVTAQQRQIARLEHETRKLTQAAEPDTPDQRPPHW